MIINSLKMLDLGYLPVTQIEEEAKKFIKENPRSHPYDLRILCIDNRKEEKWEIFFIPMDAIIKIEIAEGLKLNCHIDNLTEIKLGDIIGE